MVLDVTILVRISGEGIGMEVCGGMGVGRWEMGDGGWGMWDGDVGMGDGGWGMGMWGCDWELGWLLFSSKGSRETQKHHQYFYVVISFDFEKKRKKLWNTCNLCQRSFVVSF